MHWTSNRIDIKIRRGHSGNLSNVCVLFFTNEKASPDNLLKFIYLIACESFFGQFILICENHRGPFKKWSECELSAN